MTVIVMTINLCGRTRSFSLASVSVSEPRINYPDLIGTHVLIVQPVNLRPTPVGTSNSFT